jgi:hypothetical protein
LADPDAGGTVALCAVLVDRAAVPALGAAARVRRLPTAAGGGDTGWLTAEGAGVLSPGAPVWRPSPKGEPWWVTATVVAAAIRTTTATASGLMERFRTICHIVARLVARSAERSA